MTQTTLFDLMLPIIDELENEFKIKLHGDDVHRERKLSTYGERDFLYSVANTERIEVWKPGQETPKKTIPLDQMFIDPSYTMEDYILDEMRRKIKELLCNE